MARYFWDMPTFGGPWGATSSAAGYPASNLSRLSVRRSWRSTSLAAQTLTFEFGGLVPLRALAVVGINAVNSPVLEVSTDGFSWDSLGTQPISSVLHPLRRVWWTTGIFDYEAVRLHLSGAAFGASFFEISYVAMFLDEVPVKVPRVGAEARVIRPSYLTDLPNGRTVRSKAGAEFTELRLPWRQSGNQQQIETLSQRALDAPVLLDLQLPDRQGWWWVARTHEPQVARSIVGHNREDTSLVLREIT